MNAKVMAAAIQLERSLQAIRLEDCSLSHDRARAAMNGHAWSEILDAAVGGLRGLTALAEFERAVIDLQTVEPSLTAALLGEALTMPVSSKRAAFVIDNAKPGSMVNRGPRAVRCEPANLATSLQATPAQFV